MEDSGEKPADPAQARYLAAMHALQTGVAAEMHFRPEPTQPKHLRVGVASLFSAEEALVELLIEKGLFKREEYAEALASALEREVARYEERLKKDYGIEIALK